MNQHSRYLGQLALGFIIAAIAGICYGAKLVWLWVVGN